MADDFLEFAVDRGLVTMSLSDAGELVWEQTCTHDTPDHECPPAVKNPTRLLLRVLVVALAAVLGLTLGVLLPEMSVRSLPNGLALVSGNTPFASPDFSRLTERLHVKCEEARAGHALCVGPTRAAEVDELVGGDHMSYSFVWRTSTTSTDRTVVKIFVDPGAMSRWLSQNNTDPKSALLYGIHSKGRIVAFGTDPATVRAATNEAPSDLPEKASRG